MLYFDKLIKGEGYKISSIVSPDSTPSIYLTILSCSRGRGICSMIGYLMLPYIHTPGYSYQLHPYFPLNCLIPCTGARATESTQHIKIYTLITRSKLHISVVIPSVDKRSIVATNGLKNTSIFGLFLLIHNPEVI